MNIVELSKGGAIEIEVRYNGKTMNFRSDIILIKNNSILVTSITVNEQTIGFSDKYQINFIYKIDGRLYIWENVTVKLVKYDGGVYHKIDTNGDGKPYNRRESFRQYIGEDMPIYVNTSNGPTALSVLIKDISETGIGFVTKEDIDVERTVRLKIKDNSTIINLSGVIVRKEFLQNLGSFLYGCKFNEKSSKLSKYIARRQSEALKKKYMATPLVNERPGKSKSLEAIEKK